MHHSLLLNKYLQQLKEVSIETNSTVLDLACGAGRNGLYLVENDLSVTFADISSSAIDKVKQQLLLGSSSPEAHFWLVDFEQEGGLPLANKAFSAIMVFRYLHRPLFEQIKQAIMPNGLIIYETFTTDQVQFGRPKNPDFLLKPGELIDIFSGWEILHYFEGVIELDNGIKQSVAQIVARKLNEE